MNLNYKNCLGSSAISFFFPGLLITVDLDLSLKVLMATLKVEFGILHGERVIVLVVG